MAVRFAIASGNWSDTSIWDNGDVPLVDDIVYANGNTIGLDQDIVTGTLQNGVSPIFVPNIATPPMTGSNTPSGIASANTINGVAFPWFAFDQVSTTTWTSTAIPGQIQYQFPTSKIIRRYSILGSNAGPLNHPRNWTFEGSTDGITWDVLHTVTLGTGIPTNTWYDSGVFANSTAYLYYRVNISLLGGGGNVTFVAEIQMTESTSTAVGVTTGGSFTVSSNRTITCTNPIGMLNGNATPLITIDSNLTIIINSNLRGGLGNALRVTGLNHNITINGNVNGSSVLVNVPCINRQAIGQMTIVGDIFGGGSNSHGVLLNDTGTLTVLGNVTATDFNANNAAGISITQNATVNITGNVFSSTFNNSGNFGILSSSTSTINIIGNVQGGAISSGNVGINLTGGSTVNITGNVISGTGALTNNNAIISSVACTININGIVSATTACNAIQSTSVLANTIISGLIQNVNNRMAFYGPNLYIGNAVTQWALNKSDNTPRTLYSADTFPGVPSIVNVKQGILYGPSNDLTGALKVPPASSVAVGVPVDDTVGTAIISISDMGALLASYNV